MDILYLMFEKGMVHVAWNREGRVGYRASRDPRFPRMGVPGELG